MTAAIDAFIEEARGVTVAEAAAVLGIAVTRANHAGPCPVCGGKDRFSIAPPKNAWNCRGCGRGGRDGIGLIAHVNGHDMHQRTGFLAACAEALGRPVPDGGETESEAERAARLDRLAEIRRRNAEHAATVDREQNLYRQREIDRARGIWLNAMKGGTPLLADYLRRRTGYAMHAAVFANLRFLPNATYWHGKDERGFERAHYAGPAMVAPFVSLEGVVTGCHLTWIDLRCAPKLRPDIRADDGEALPTKKMRGAKKGSLVPLFGVMAAMRWMGGEGIENVLSVAGAEDFRADTFYFAAGDLGNLAGPADPKSAFAHPHLTKEDRRGRILAVRVPGPEPKADQASDEAILVPDQVDELILLADGDSEFVFTSAAMARAEKRLSRAGRAIETWWPPDGSDFSGLMTGAK